jgi:hypothetical protein
VPAEFEAQHVRLLVVDQERAFLPAHHLAAQLDQHAQDLLLGRAGQDAEKAGEEMAGGRLSGGRHERIAASVEGSAKLLLAARTVRGRGAEHKFFFAASPRRAATFRRRYAASGRSTYMRSEP